MNLHKIKNSAKAGFTLIELLVVITIIGILATGATATYTSQIQKARDTTRTTDISALVSWIEQFYQDKFEYPSVDDTDTYGSYFDWVNSYVPKFPKDPKSGQLCNKWDESNATACDYLYAVSDDENGILFWEYKVSTWFENLWNIESKAAVDNWNEDNRYEMWLNLSSSNKSTVCDRTTGVTVSWLNAITSSICTTWISNTNGNWTIMIAWND